MTKRIVRVAVAASLFGACLTAFATEATSDGFPPAQNLDYHHGPGPDLAADGSTGPSGVIGSQYLFIAGSAFTPRSNSQSVSYPGGGCSTTDGAVTTSLELADGAVVQGVRLYYYNNGLPGSAVRVFLTTYTGLGGSTDLIGANSTESIGYSSEYFAAASPLVIDNVNQSHVLTSNMDANLRLCGMRVFYSP